jgi:hypothetical protein
MQSCSNLRPDFGNNKSYSPVENEEEFYLLTTPVNYVLSERSISILSSSKISNADTLQK